MPAPTPGSALAPRGHTPRLADAVSCLLESAADLVTADDLTADLGLLDVGAQYVCEALELPPAAAPTVLRRAAHALTRASGYHPLDAGDPVIDRALDELPTYPHERQARLLRYAARHAVTCTAR